MRAQVVRQLIGALVDFAIAEPLTCVMQRCGLRRACCPVFPQLVKSGDCREFILRRAHRPVLQQYLFFVVAQHGQCANPRGRLLCHGHGQILIVLCHTRDGGWRKQSGIVFQRT